MTTTVPQPTTTMNDPVASSSIVDEHVEPAVAETTTTSTNDDDDDGTDLLATQATMTTVAVVDEPTATAAESGLLVVEQETAVAATTSSNNNDDMMLLCSICFEENPTDMILLTQCPHKWCRDCLVKIIETEEENTATTITAQPTDTAVSVTCPECRTQLTTQEIDTILYRPSNVHDRCLRGVMMSNDADQFASYPWLRPTRRKVYRDQIAKQVVKDGANVIKEILRGYRMECLRWLLRLLMMTIVFRLPNLEVYNLTTEVDGQQRRIIETRDYDTVLKEILEVVLVWFSISLLGDLIFATGACVKCEERLNIPFKTLIYLVYSPSSWMEEKILKMMIMDHHQQQEQGQRREQRNKYDFLVPFLFPYMAMAATFALIMGYALKFTLVLFSSFVVVVGEG